MGTIPPPFVLQARPIRALEFMDALALTCPPIFGSLFRTPGTRDVAVAVSGGVDSMALAVLCSLSASSVHLKIGDHRPRAFRPLVVEHGIREGDGAEVAKVIKELSKLNLQTQLSHLKLKWSDHLREHDADHPSKLPGLEALARKLRYRAFAKFCVGLQINSLLVAHHEDDQYETILMRLLGGHGARGLRGMQRAADIPESYDIHRAYRSGFHDDRTGNRQLYIMLPTPKQRGALRDTFRELDPEQYQTDLRLAEDPGWGLPQDLLCEAHVGPWSKTTTPLNTLDIEDGGITVYRPLLGFPKKRLEATCLVHGIKWFEDYTNTDPTFATRNALRHICSTYTLPKALQKTSILQLAEKCNDMVRAQDAEVGRLLKQTTMSNFQPNVGTVVVQFPPYGTGTFPMRDRRNPERRRLRTLKRRAVAAQALRKCFSLVSPSLHTDLNMLQGFVDVFFPGLSQSPPSSQAGSPSPIALAGVYCVPLATDEDAHGVPVTKWLLSRAPYPAIRQPRLIVGTTKYPTWKRLRSTNLRFRNYDNRFWISLNHRLPAGVVVAPFSPRHSKSFREALEAPERRRLEALLKQYAPGKSRFTLPAIYLTGVRKGNYMLKELDSWGEIVDRMGIRDVDKAWDSSAEGIAGSSSGDKMVDSGDGGSPGPKFMLEIPPVRTMVALPTLGIQVKGLERLIRCEVRYKNVDLAMLNESGTWGSSDFWVRPDWEGRDGWAKWETNVRAKITAWRCRKKADLRIERMQRTEEYDDRNEPMGGEMLDDWY